MPSVRAAPQRPVLSAQGFVRRCHNCGSWADITFHRSSVA
jgi:hypothetical protein